MATAGRASIFRRALLGLSVLGIFAVIFLSVMSGSDSPSAHLLRQQETLLKLRFAFLMVAISFLLVALIAGRRYASLRTKVAIFFIPFLALSIFAIYKNRYGLEEPVYLAVVREDSIVEYVTFGFLVLTSVFAVATARLVRRMQMRGVVPLLLLLAAFALFVGLEEISYGQRIFGFGTPEGLEELNTQGEFNIHNISSFGELTYVLLPNLVVAYCLFGWALLSLLRVTFPRLLHHLPGIETVIVPWYVASYFIPLAIYRWFEIGGYPMYPCCFAGQFLIWQDQEPAEMFFGLGFLLFAFDRFRVADNWMTTGQLDGPDGSSAFSSGR